ncbi:MAG: tetratricopeptide repeat protein [Deltaproteobacteria bacterium]|nr:tetratricopeptide repeat protein [Deltaproteobacteria bacterium]
MSKIWIAGVGIVLTALLGLMIWLVSGEPEREPLPEPRAEIALREPEPQPGPAPPARPAESQAEPKQAPDRTEMPAAGGQQDPDGPVEGSMQTCKKLLIRRDYERATQCLSSYLARKPDDAHAYRLRGAARLHLGERAEGYSDYQKCLELDPDGPYARVLRRILDEYDEWASRTDLPLDGKRDPREGEGCPREVERLYEEAFTSQYADPQASLEKLREALKMLPDDEMHCRERIERLVVSIELHQRSKAGAR